MTTIRGFAATFDVAFVLDEHRFRLEPGCFRLAGAVIPLCFGHDQSRLYASTWDGSMRVWEGEFGLQFEADVEDGTRAGYGLVAGIARGTYNQVSCLYSADRQSRIETVAGERVEVIERTAIFEISIVPAGACPGTAAWLADQTLDDMSPAIRSAALLWRERQPIAAHRHVTPSARPQPAPRYSPGGGNAAPPPRARRAEPPHCPPSVIAVLERHGRLF